MAKDKKRYSIDVDEETRNTVRDRAKAIGMSQGAYVRLMVAQCKPDISIKSI